MAKFKRIAIYPIAPVRRAYPRRCHNTGRYYQCLMFAGL
jgi:hypothetical protein